MTIRILWYRCMYFWKSTDSVITIFYIRSITVYEKFTEFCKGLFMSITVGTKDLIFSIGTTICHKPFHTSDNIWMRVILLFGSSFIHFHCLKFGIEFIRLSIPKSCKIITLPFFQGDRLIRCPDPGISKWFTICLIHRESVFTYFPFSSFYV